MYFLAPNLRSRCKRTRHLASFLNELRTEPRGYFDQEGFGSVSAQLTLPSLAHPAVPASPSASFFAPSSFPSSPPLQTLLILFLFAPCPNFYRCLSFCPSSSPSVSSSSDLSSSIRSLFS
eukprot:754627-Hanusia_phi.AAC.1